VGNENGQREGLNARQSSPQARRNYEFAMDR
jgi:hypothetical protein